MEAADVNNRHENGHQFELERNENSQEAQSISCGSSQMNTNSLFSSLSISEKRERLKALVDKRLNMTNKKGELKRHETPANGNVKRKKLNSHSYKMLFKNAGQKLNLLNQVNGMNANESSSGFNRKKGRVALNSEGVYSGNQESANEPFRISSMDGTGCETVLKTGEPADVKHGSGGFCAICKADGELLLCSGQGCGKSFQRSCLDPPLPSVSHGAWNCGSCTKNKTKSGSAELSEFQFEVSSEIRSNVLPYVNKLRDYWCRSHNAVFFDGQDRLLKVVLFVLSLLNHVKQPILVIAATKVLPLWEAEFSKWSKLTNVVTYKGNRDIRAAIRASGFYSENGSITFQVLLCSPDAIVEDLDMLDHIKWELMVIDECQRPTISTHSKTIKLLVADMKLLTVTGESVDIRQSYQNILSQLDSKYEEIHTESDVETNILKEKLSPFIAFECKISTLELEEYWVPVHLSSMQIEQYCSILQSNSEELAPCIKNISPLHNILIQTHKCCDHPYLVDPTLCNSSRRDASIDPLGAEINVSGKLQILDKLLLDIKQCGLRALVLFQPVESSGNISIGDILDDLVHQRFGQDSYVCIPGKVSSKSAREKRKQSIKLFNCVESRKFVCVYDYRAAHHSSFQLSHVDVVILFNSNWNPSYDIKALYKIASNAHDQPLKVFRLYSSFTIEEKALIFSKQGTPLPSSISHLNWTMCHQLLAWGASHLLSKLQGDTSPKNPSSETSFVDNLVQDLSFLLRNKRGETGHSVISNSQMRDGAYSPSISLLGETESHTIKSLSVDEYLIENGPSDFWTNLLNESQLREKSSACRLSRRTQKSPQSSFYWFQGFGPYEDASTSPSITKNRRSKRRVRDKAKQSKQAGAQTHVGGHQSSNMSPTSDQGEIQTETPTCNLPDAQSPIATSTCISDSDALNPRTNGGQQCQDNQPPHTSSSTPLDIEIERMQKNREQLTKLHQEKKSMLLSECEKEISEVQKKYDVLINESDMSLANQMKTLDEYQDLVNANKLLAEIFAQNFDYNINASFLKRSVKETSSFRILEIPASALVRPANPCSTSGLTTNFSGYGLGGAGPRAPAPHLRSKPSFHNLPIRPAPSFFEPLPTLSTPQTLPPIPTELNGVVYQVKNMPDLLMEFDRICKTDGPSLPFLGSSHGSF